VRQVRSFPAAQTAEVDPRSYLGHSVQSVNPIQLIYRLPHSKPGQLSFKQDIAELPHSKSEQFSVEQASHHRTLEVSD